MGMTGFFDSGGLRVGVFTALWVVAVSAPPAASGTSNVSACVGDCDNSGAVSIDELVKGVKIALGDLALDQCPSLDCNASGQVTVNCIIKAVAAALGGCGPPAGAATLFTMSNAQSGNSVVAYAQRPDGTLLPAGSYATGGLGVEHGLENQGALALSDDQAYLLVVNPGSDDVSALRISRDGLQWTARAPSGGRLPVSVAERGGLVYVLNRGSDVGDPSAGTISGLRLNADGDLAAIPGSTLPLSTTATGAAQIAFSPDGAFIVVTERDTGLIDTFSVGPDGVAGSPRTQPSAGRGPFGFAFRNASQVYVSEAGGASASAYELDSQGVLHAISAAVQTGQAATCWLAITPDQRLAFVTNTSAHSISALDIAPDGTLSLRTAVAATTDGGPIDLTISSNGRFLNVVTTSGDIEVFQINSESAALSEVDLVTELPRGTNGLVGF
jgi:6-phosphogluconolactonase (cycloisomerase 2 family)